MAKLHVLMQKEMIDPRKLEGKVAVVLDVLLATSTIISSLNAGASQVIPVKNEQEARDEMKRRAEEGPIVTGEFKGRTIEGFLDPLPTYLKQRAEGRTVILSTTNGTVAIRKALGARHVYIGALLNGEALIQHLFEEHPNETIILICSGSSDSFCMEDFYGAGYLVSLLDKISGSQWELTDAALTAKIFYEANQTDAEKILLNSRVGKMMAGQGLEEEVIFVAQQGVMDEIPELRGNALTSGAKKAALKEDKG
ncbi:2-phosphosulfolactate phosphatase [Pseudalkalibacillus caeni]|uniref:Probable 2-phosphosulfolactate phosphatase n=1 Tax=Exobacillus caeni TaxID=2574798 RepID=A0A5R9FCL4_9BACL|nr:2-phosphosulfolactate phosphatase [Pseudalkalibacillus caeni]TLS38294.1 2-phosphosulfolactate phosphatase [Pseudalkalibacillus caeni]